MSATETEKMDPELGNGEIQTEVDPCLPLAAPAPDPLPNANTPKKKLTFSNHNGRVTWPGSELEGLLRKKYGLNREGFLLSLFSWLLLFLLLVVILVLIVLWPRASSSGQLCTQPACFRASASILPAMDRDADRCQRLYAYSCNGWSAVHPRPPATRHRWDRITELKLRLAEDIRDLVATLPHPTHVTSITWKIKHFYDSCMALDNIETDNKRPIKGIISELGGWNVLRDFSVLSWDFSQTFVRLHAEYGVNPFFTISVVDDPFNANASIIEIKPPVLALPLPHLFQHKEGDIASSYREFLKDVVQVFGATSVEANLFSNELFFFERQLAEIIPPASELTDARTHQIINVSHLKSTASSLPILEILRALLPDGNIAENTAVLVQSPRYLNSLSRILSTVDRSALNNYIIWHLVKAYLPYLSQDLQQLHSVYLRHTKGIQEPLERWEFCAETLLRFQGVAIAARLQKRIPEEERLRRRGKLENLFEHVKWAVKDSVTKAEWIDLELYKHIVKKLDGLKMISALTDDEMSDVYLEAFYKKSLVQKNDFFRNIRYGVDFLKHQMLRKYLRINSTAPWLEEIMEPKVTYLPSKNTIVVGQALLREPWFHPDYPVGLLYGALGTEIAGAVLSAILPPYGLYSHNGTLLPTTGLVANLSRTCIDRQIACLMGNSSAQGLTTFLAVSSLRQSLKALRRDVSNGDYSTQPGLENLTEGELLILRYAQSHCIVQTQQDEIIDIATTAPLRGPALLQAITDNLKAATDTLGCSAPSSPCKHLL